MDVTDLDSDPLRQLATWLNAARAAGQPMPEAMTIASATSDAVPSARLVVLRGFRRGLVFFTDCESDKGAELAANPRAAAVLHWLVPAHRQVRVAGPVERVSEDEADEYWSTRTLRPPQRGRLAPKPRCRRSDGVNVTVPRGRGLRRNTTGVQDGPSLLRRNGLNMPNGRADTPSRDVRPCRARCRGA